jgi:uncharacterized protein (DUF2249 family)
MTITPDTKIAPILKHDPKALDAIVSISSKFEKLRNPILRRVMAGRTTLSAAAKMGGCSVEDFFAKLEPLGFDIDRKKTGSDEASKPLPAFIRSLKPDQLVELDVRPIIASGNDPLQTIMEKLKTVQTGQVLKITNTFEPTPLILMLEKKGFETYLDHVDENLIETYFFRAGNETQLDPVMRANANNFEDIMEGFGEKIRKIDVRNLEMPQPMLAILDALDHLPSGTALFVYHKRIPVFLLPELVQRGFDYRIKEIENGEVHLLIFESNGGNNK